MVVAVVSPAAGSRRLQSLGSAFVPTLGGMLRFGGSNFGGFGLTANVLAVMDLGGAGLQVLNVTNLTQTSVDVQIPPGDGVGHTLQVRGGASMCSQFLALLTAPSPPSVQLWIGSNFSPLCLLQTITGSAAEGCQPSNVVTFNYSRPSIASVAPQFSLVPPQLPLLTPSSGGVSVS